MNETSLQSLSDHLFAQLDRLGKDGLTPEEIETEATRAKAIVDISDQIIGGAKTQLDAAKTYAMHGDRVLPMLPQIGNAAPPAQQIEGKAEDKA